MNKPKNVVLYTAEGESLKKEVVSELDIPDPTIEEAMASINTNTEKDGEAHEET